MLEKAFIIIPAFNEEKQIATVIESAQMADASLIETEHVVVVDNNSTDKTTLFANRMGATVLNCELQGKGWAMLEGANYALNLGAAALTFLDADLIGIKPSHINLLTAPVLDQQAIMNIGYLGGRTALQKMVLKKWGAFSGQRSVSLEVWDELRPPDFESWRIEGALNAICRNLGKGDLIKKIELAGLRHTGTRKKEANLGHAGLKYLQKYSSAVRGLTSKSGLTKVELANIK